MEFNGYSFDERKHRRRMRYLVIHCGDLDINNAYAFTSKAKLKKYLREPSGKEPMAVFAITDLTDDFPGATG